MAIVGTGFAGLGMAIRLKQEGIDDFVVLERGDDVGGTWRDNTYPGCACDIPSHLYSFSFAPNPNWSHTYSPQPEILDYLRRCAQEFGVMPHIRFGHDMLGAAWSEDQQRWAIRTSGGALSADVLVAGFGPLAEPSLPAIPGFESFEGTTFHSARWDHDHDLTGERVAVVGTGATAIQIVPSIQPAVERLYVFQRTPPWIVRHRGRPISERERRLYRRLPAAQLLVRGATYALREALVPALMGNRRLGASLERLARRHLEEQVHDPALRERVTPDYAFGCKRILPSNDYLPALECPNVDLVTQPIADLRQRSIVTADGREFDLDTLILATGFHVTDSPAAGLVRGRDGRTLAEVWAGAPRAHRGTTIAGFPNYFMLAGPNTGLGHNSIVYMIESQFNYVIDALRLMEDDAVAVVEPRPEAQDTFNRRLDREMTGSVWTSGSCASWYLDARGRNSALWPGWTRRFRRLTRHLDRGNYRLTRGARRRHASPAAAR